MIEAGAELIELFLGDAFGVTGQDLVLHLVDGPVDTGHQLLPTHAQSLHGVLSVTILEDEGFLDLLVDPFQFFQMGFELVDGFLIFTQPRQLVFQRALKNTSQILIFDLMYQNGLDPCKFKEEIGDPELVITVPNLRFLSKNSL